MNRIKFLFIMTVVLLCSCKKSTITTQYVGVQLTDSEWWSIIDTKNGQFVVRDEFKNEPSPIINDMFHVKNDATGGFDVYNVSDPKKAVNKESYKGITDFSEDGLALAVKSGEGICIIDKKCNVVAELSHDIKRCGLFHDGLALFEDQNEKYGYINKKGEVVIKAKYDGALVFEEGYALVGIADGNGEIKKFDFIDKKENVISSFNASTISGGGKFSEGVMAVNDTELEDVYFINKKGEKVGSKFGKWSTGSYCMIDGKTVFYDGNVYGLKSKDGEILIRAKYEDLLPSSISNLYYAKKNEKVGLIDDKDGIVLDFDYDDIFVVGSNTFFVRNGETFSLINKDGKDICKESFQEIDLDYPDYRPMRLGSYELSSVRSDYFDAAGIVTKIFNNIKEESCFGKKANATLESFQELIQDAEARKYSGKIYLYEQDGYFQKYYLFDDYLSVYDPYEYGYVFNKYANCIAIKCEIDVSYYSETAKEKFRKEFYRQLKDKGYTSNEGQIWWTKDNKNYIGIPQEFEGRTVIFYYTFDSEFNNILIQDTSNQYYDDEDYDY
ncbi:MAG: WG repeat-containing protein [Paludibacteraceae bacterium]|nr:WG repeat-containing protein [Paludibacteraceae bacterium]